MVRDSLGFYSKSMSDVVHGGRDIDVDAQDEDGADIRRCLITAGPVDDGDLSFSNLLIARPANPWGLCSIRSKGPTAANGSTRSMIRA